jgi:hypothetical protein
MRRATISFFLAICLAAIGVGVAAAAPPDKTCPGGDSGFASFALNTTWQPGDAIPGAGEDEWWDLTVAGFTAEGLTPATAATLFGFGSAEELYEAVHFGILGLDKNGDGAVCAKPFPDHQNGQPAYIFNAIDGNAREH